MSQDRDNIPPDHRCIHGDLNKILKERDDELKIFMRDLLTAQMDLLAERVENTQMRHHRDSRELINAAERRIDSVQAQTEYEKGRIQAIGGELDKIRDKKIPEMEERSAKTNTEVREMISSLQTLVKALGIVIAAATLVLAYIK